MSSFRFMRRDSPRVNCRGPRPGPIASAVTGRRQSPGTGWPGWAGLPGMARLGSRGGWRRRGGPHPRPAAGRRCLHGGCEPADLRPDRMAGTVRARPPSGGAERPRARAAGGVGSMVTQLAREAGAYVIGTGRTADRQTALDFGAKEFVDLENDALEDVGEVDLVFDVIGGDIQKRSAGLIRAGGTLVSIAGPGRGRPPAGLAVAFVVESDRAQLTEIVQRVRDGRLRTNIGTVSSLDDAVAAFNPTERIKAKRITGKPIILLRP